MVCPLSEPKTTVVRLSTIESRRGVISGSKIPLQSAHTYKYFGVGERERCGMRRQGNVGLDGDKVERGVGVRRGLSIADNTEGHDDMS